VSKLDKILINSFLCAFAPLRLIFIEDGMANEDRITHALKIINSVNTKSLTRSERADLAIDLASVMLAEANTSQTAEDKSIQNQLARMMHDPIGRVFVTQVTDQCFRSNNSARVANQLVFLLKKLGIPSFLPFSKKTGLLLFKWFGNLFPALFVPIARKMIQKETTKVILPGEPEALNRHLEERKQEGIRVNLNHLGEAILGEEEAEHRLNIYLDDLKNPQIEYISVKISTVCSQINPIAWQNTIELISKRLRILYQVAQQNRFQTKEGKSVQKFVNLDMEEYRDLRLTIDAFKKVLEEPQFFNFSAGVVLQAYLPDSYGIQQELTEWAKNRLQKGGAPIKIRLVKGANLAMEKVEGSLRDWPQAPYLNKQESDANFKRMLEYACRPENAAAVHIGVGSHNLFDIAYALLLRKENHIEPYVTFEMLEGMADHIRRVVHKVSGTMLLYCPAASQHEFQNAVAYLIRRLDENTSPENFLRHSFGLQPGSREWNEQAEFFKTSCGEVDSVSAQPNRTQNRLADKYQKSEEDHFVNEPDTDWSLPANVEWINQIVSKWKKHQPGVLPLVIGNNTFTSSSVESAYDPANPSETYYQFTLADRQNIDQAFLAAENAFREWSKQPIKLRSQLLAAIANGLRKKRGDLIGAMMADTGKTVHEADVEVSEAIDFAEYYRRNIEELSSLSDIEWTPKGTVLVAPPWNFPCSIPAGGILAALAAGNCVLFKPPKESVLVGWELVQIFWEAGIGKDVLQFITCEDDPIGSELIKDPRLAAVVLTGSTDTAKLFFKMRPGLDLVAETGGKNAIIVTSMADRDLAIKDIVQSAFGHSGQKCSACSLLICEAEIYDDPHFLNTLKNAAESLKVGSQWDLSTKVGPLIGSPNPALKRALTSLDDGEAWLLEPKQDSKNPNLWSPGIKIGVKEGSFTHTTELFGPVLAVMRANHLPHALKLADGTRYGLTAGLHSLDEREQSYWLRNIVAGNCYINRTITGAIVQRQPFGGCKESGFGPGAKAGGPNYVMQLMHPGQKNSPEHNLPIQLLRKKVQSIDSSLRKILKPKDLDIWTASVGSYGFFWKNYFSKRHDPSGILGQDNLFYYVPREYILLRLNSNDAVFDAFIAVAAALICGTFLEISTDNREFFNILKPFHDGKNIKVTLEQEKELINRISKNNLNRFRFFSKPSPALEKSLADSACNVIISKPLANGRIELLKFLREVSISRDYHRYGYLGLRENEKRGPKDEEPGGCCQAKCGSGCC